MYLTIHHGDNQLCMLAMPSAPQVSDTVVDLIRGAKYRIMTVTHMATDQLADYHAEAQVEPIAKPAAKRRPTAKRKPVPKRRKTGKKQAE